MIHINRYEAFFVWNVIIVAISENGLSFVGSERYSLKEFLVTLLQIDRFETVNSEM